MPLADDRLRLELLDERHLDGLRELGTDPEVQRYTYVPVPWPEGYERRWLDRYLRGRRERTSEAFAIVDERDGSFLGIAVLLTLDLPGRQAEAGYIVAPAARGRGVASRALERLARWAFAELGLERIELRISADNEPSLRVAERAGFTREGTLRNVHFKNDLRSDVAVYSLLRAEYDPDEAA